MVALGQKEPTGQGTGAVELTGQYCVVLHGVEAVERAAQYAPAGHTEMVLVVFAEPNAFVPATVTL